MEECEVVDVIRIMRTGGGKYYFVSNEFESQECDSLKECVNLMCKLLFGEPLEVE